MDMETITRWAPGHDLNIISKNEHKPQQGKPSECHRCLQHSRVQTPNDQFKSTPLFIGENMYYSSSLSTSTTARARVTGCCDTKMSAVSGDYSRSTLGIIQMSAFLWLNG